MLVSPLQNSKGEIWHLSIYWQGDDMKKAILLTLSMLGFILIACSTTKESIEEEIPLKTPRTDALTLDLDYEGKSYLVDGIGEVKMATCEDGDTAEFIVDGQQIRVRFLGIDTPEASHFYEPWGYEATLFACERLANAETIVLERDFEGPLRDNYGRYLAFIWYDGRLLNLELIEASLSTSTRDPEKKYGVDFLYSWWDAEETNRRIHGEDDPLFDYSTEGVETTIENIVNNVEDYNFKKVTVEGVITNMMGIHAFIEDGDHGIFFYIGHTEDDNLKIGTRVRLEHVRMVYEFERRGGPHLTDYDSENVIVLGVEEVVPILLNLEALNETHLGRLLRFEGVTIESLEANVDGSLTIQVRDEKGNTINIIHVREAFPHERIDINELTIGDRININATPRAFSEGLQLLLTNREHLEIVD